MKQDYVLTKHIQTQRMLRKNHGVWTKPFAGIRLSESGIFLIQNFVSARNGTQKEQPYFCQINMNIIEQNYEDILRLAYSIKDGVCIKFIKFCQKLEKQFHWQRHSRKWDE